MKKRLQISNTRSDECQTTTFSGGLAVRTNLRAGLAWDDLDDQASALWGKLTSAVSNATSALSTGSDASKPAA
ncbi:MAG: hypothetical protein NT075_23990 [Chloroflexi bacterium]|nr:hypothetical protein [Chloroflexota bacterium]